MNRILERNQFLRQQGEKALVVYLTAGYPDWKTCLELVPALEQAGADYIELGLPFSDPVADGATIQETSRIALEQGMTTGKFFALAADMRRRTTLPLIVMTYYNPVFKFGLEQFAAAAKQSGIDGIIVPDLPPEEAGALQACLRRHDLCQIFLVSPVSTKERIKKIVAAAQGFVYYVCLTGVTGARAGMPTLSQDQIKTIRNVTDLPVFAGFGISTPQQAAQIRKTVDGVIIGSALLDIIRQRAGKKDLPQAVQTFLRSFQ